MKFLAHVKALKEDPPSVQTAGILGHTHVHALPYVDDSVVPKNYVDQYVDTQLTHINKFGGGPVFMGLDLAGQIKPDKISVSQALDALRSHGVLFQNVSLHMSADSTELKCDLHIVGKEAKQTAMAVHQWLYAPGKDF
ncbi:hypothetical protein [Hyphomicrobium sp. ghe19]|uniref:hypothetical protein n=1 Tax=Hyphomicrobium sp. ghe19 TaxID=2682968 RepID=UPI00136691FF|nr:hypothetical protein HYPP_02462 [Hyphomicrobium sp. ghe19]